MWALLSPSGLRLPVVVLSIVYTKADWKSGAAARMSKEESNYGQKEERRGENPPRIDFLLSPGKGQSGALSRLVPPREFLSNSETALDEPRRADDVVHLVQRRRRKRLLGKIETRGHKFTLALT